ncbi:MAG: heparan-alpha-glucosaminide N-acetyltransferase domain-containing protein [Chryseolinea sp.]
MQNENTYGMTKLAEHAAVSFGHKPIAADVTKPVPGRVESIDLLRGFVMIIMAIDHIREFFHADAFVFSPTDLQHTTVPIFLTRWITHLCAPAFIFLSGTSIYFIAQRKSKTEKVSFLLSRGLWLIVLQMTVVRFAWNFDIYFRYNAHTILSVIGVCMILMSVFIYFSTRTLVVIGVIVVAAHNLFDSVSFAPDTVQQVLWAFLHKPGTYQLVNGYVFNFMYPLIPWIGVMMLGYCAGRLYQSDYSSEGRRELLFLIGGFCILGFVVIRAVNIYGDPSEWSIERNGVTTFLSFINLTKYPPSLLYLCATLGISLIALAALESRQYAWLRPVSVFGKVALFYYVAHLFLIHTLALIVVATQGLPLEAMIYPDSVKFLSPLLVGKFGFSLAEVYIIWVCVILILYPCCVAWNKMKTRMKAKWWVSYV